MTSQPGPRPSVDLRGAVDLGALASARRTTSAPGAASGVAAGSTGTGAVIEVTDATFRTDVIEQSMTVPVVLDFWADWCGPCKQLSPILIKLAQEHEGRFLLATVDVDANPQLSAAFQVQSIPSIYAVIGGQPVPLFQGAQPEAQVRQVIAELLKVAAANGIDGRIDLGGAAGEADVPDEADEELPPHHQAAYDAIEAGDLEGAAAAYEAALREDPSDEMAKLGLGQTKLLQRTTNVDPVAARAAAAQDPSDVAAQCLVADLDVLGGHVADAFTRLIDTVRATGGDSRDLARTHLLGLFDVVGAEDPRVVQARLALASALF